MRTVHPPTEGGRGDGRVVYFFLATGEPTEIEGDVQALTGQGYAVVVHTAPTLETLREALYGQDPELEGSLTVGVSWSGPASADGSLRQSDGRWIAPAAITPAHVTHELDWVTFKGPSAEDHAAIWRGHVGERVKVRAKAKGAPAEIDGEHAENLERDTYWNDLFALIGPERGRTIESQLGLTTRQYMWRLGELLAAAAIHQLQDDARVAAQRFEAASAAAQLLTDRLPPLFEESGDASAAIDYLTETVPRSALGRAALRFGDDHAALLDGALRLLLLALPDEVSDPMREALRPLGQRAGLDPELWETVLSMNSKALFSKGHEEISDALAGERKPRHVTRALSFGLGRRLALAATLDADVDPTAADEMIVSCQDMTALLKLDMPAKLERLGRFPRTAEAVSERHGPDHAALFTLATQLIALRFRYDPMSPETTFRLMRRVSRARKKAALPKRLFKNLKRLNEGTASRSKGSDMVNLTLQAISEHLSTEMD